MASSTTTTTSTPIPSVQSYCIQCPNAVNVTENPAGTAQGLKSLLQFLDFDYSQVPSYSQYITNKMRDGNQEVVEVMAKELCFECSEVADLFGILFAKYGGYCYMTWACVLTLSERLKMSRPRVLESHEAELRKRILSQCELKLQAKGLDRPKLEELLVPEMEIIGLLEEVDAYVSNRQGQV